MKIMSTWMTLEELDGADTRREYKGRDGESLARIFNYCQPFVLYFRYRHQVHDHNNRRHDPIKFRGHGQPSSGPIETLHDTWL